MIPYCHCTFRWRHESHIQRQCVLVQDIKNQRLLASAPRRLDIGRFQMVAPCGGRNATRQFFFGTKQSHRNEDRGALFGSVKELLVRPRAPLIAFDTGMGEDEIRRRAAIGGDCIQDGLPDPASVLPYALRQRRGLILVEEAQDRVVEPVIINDLRGYKRTEFFGDGQLPDAWKSQEQNENTHRSTTLPTHPPVTTQCRTLSGIYQNFHHGRFGSGGIEGSGASMAFITIISPSWS